MGACSSTDIYDLENVRKCQREFEALQLTRKEVGKLYRIFRKVDVDGSGSIALIELLCHVDVERTPFTERVFSIFDEDGSGEIDFREFVLALWNYCTLSKATLDLFAFDLYDRDSSGFLSPHEVHRMLKDIYGKSVKTNHHAKSIAADLKAMEKDDGDINGEQFCKFAKTHHALLFPAFEMQQLLQRKVLGTAFWYKNAERRIEVSKGRFIPIAKFMELHMNSSLYHQTVNSPAVVTAEVRQDAKIALSVTGSKAKRQELAVLKKEEEGRRGYSDLQVIPSVDSNDGEARYGNHLSYSANKKTELDRVHEKMNDRTQVKVLSVKDGELNHANLHKKRSSISVIPESSKLVAQVAASEKPMQQSDDGNPSAKLPLFQNFSVKSEPGATSNRRRRSTADATPSFSAGGGTGGAGASAKSVLKAIEEVNNSVSEYKAFQPPAASEKVEAKKGGAKVAPGVSAKPQAATASVKDANNHYLNAFKAPAEKQAAEEKMGEPTQEDKNARVWASLDELDDQAKVVEKDKGKKAAGGGKRRRSIG